MKKKIKYSLSICSTFLLLFAVLLFFFVITPRIKISNLQKRYNKIEKGMSFEQVESIMGQNTNPKFSNNVEWWDQEKLTKEEIILIDKTIVYTVKTFFLPVNFGFSFDKSGKVLGKHRYD